MISRNTITYSMLGLFAAAAGSTSALAFGSPFSDPMNLLSDPHPVWEIDESGSENPWLINPLNPDNAPNFPKDVGHTDQGPVARPTGGSGGMSPLMSTPAQPAAPTPGFSSAHLADLLGRLDLTILGAPDQPGAFTLTELAPLLDIDAGSLGDAPFSAPTPSLAIPAPGAIVLIGLAGAMAGVRRRR